MTHLVTAILALAVAASAPIANAQSPSTGDGGRTVGEERAISLCSTCHGPRGVAPSAEFPNLAAQRPEYIAAQLRNFQSRTREEKPAHDMMWGIAGNLDATTIESIAAYYAAQPPAPGQPGDPTQIASGKKLFETGVADRGVPPCASCHGENAQGEADFPRLAGQHAKYVRRQLEYIQGLVRQAPVMHGIVKELTPAEIEALAAYVQSL